MWLTGSDLRLSRRKGEQHPQKPDRTPPQGGRREGRASAAGLSPAVPVGFAENTISWAIHKHDVTFRRKQVKLSW